MPPGAADTARQSHAPATPPGRALPSLAGAVFTAPVVGWAHEAALAVYAWTVTDREGAAALADVGVDAVVSDAPDVLPG